MRQKGLSEFDTLTLLAVRTPKGSAYIISISRKINPIR